MAWYKLEVTKKNNLYKNFGLINSYIDWQSYQVKVGQKKYKNFEIF